MTASTRAAAALRTLRATQPAGLPAARIPFASQPATGAAGMRAFSVNTPRRAGDSHGSHYDPPSGWLFGVPPGKTYEKEGWEGLWVWGFFGSLGVAVVAYNFKPDTK